MKGYWRTGTRVPINVYDGERPVCQCQTAEDARRIVAAVNETVNARIAKEAADAIPKPNYILIAEWDVYKDCMLKRGRA